MSVDQADKLQERLEEVFSKEELEFLGELYHK